METLRNELAEAARARTDHAAVTSLLQEAARERTDLLHAELVAGRTKPFADGADEVGVAAALRIAENRAKALAIKNHMQTKQAAGLARAVGGAGAFAVWGADGGGGAEASAAGGADMGGGAGALAAGSAGGDAAAVAAAAPRGAVSFAAAAAEALAADLD